MRKLANRTRNKILSKINQVKRRRSTRKNTRNKAKKCITHHVKHHNVANHIKHKKLPKHVSDELKKFKKNVKHNQDKNILKKYRSILDKFVKSGDIHRHQANKQADKFEEMHPDHKHFA